MLSASPRGAQAAKFGSVQQKRRRRGARPRGRTSDAMRQRPVGGVRLVHQDEPQGEERRHEGRPLPLHRAGEKQERS